MEQKGAQNVGHDREGLSKRRLSSILKASRTSMKVCGSDPDENQDETRPIEKRRNSRRVSFATTNKVRVFPNDIKAEPVLAPIQNLPVGANEGQNERTQSFDTSVKHDLTGLDTMLTQPIHIELNKENFFPEPSLPVDRTVLLGEDTGYMDMTYSHTVVLEKEGELYPDFTLNMSNISESHKLNIPNGLPCKSFNSMEKGVMQSQFDDFLASLSKAGAQNVPKKDYHSTLENFSKTDIGEEDVLPSCLTEVAHLERDDMDITNIHPVMREEAFQQFSYSVGENCRSTDATSSTNYLDDMELTRNQTHTINFKGSGNTNQSMHDTDQKKCTFVCDDPSEMILTEVLDECVQYPEQLSEQNPFQSSTSFAPVAHSDQKEVFLPQTVVSKTGEGKISMPLAAHDQDDFMDLTGQASTGVLSRIHDGSMFTECSNVAVGSKRNTETCAMMSKPQASSISQLADPAEVKRSNHFKHELSHSHMVDDIEITHHTVCNMDMTRHTVCNMDMTRHTVCNMDMTRHTVCNMDMTRQTVCNMDMTRQTVCNMDMTRQTVCNDMDMTRQTVSNNMDMTPCQTVGETKSCDNLKPLDKAKKRLSLVSTAFKAGHGMIPEHTGHVELNRYSFSKRTKTEKSVVPTAQRFLHQDLSNSMEPQQGTACDMTVMHGDMELTGFKTITIDTSPSNKTSSAPCTISSRPTKDQMRRSEATLEQVGTGFASQTDCRSPIPVMDLDAGNLEDMARDQTTDKTIDHKNSKPGKAEESSEEDSHMVITSVFTSPLEKQCVAYHQEETARETMETTLVTTEQKISKETESDIDSLKKEHSSSAKYRRRSLADLQAKLQNISQSIREPDALSAGSVTAPLVRLTAVSPVEKRSEMPNFLQPFQETALLHGNKLNMPPKATTPFNLKNSLMARLSVSGIMPKFPPRAGSAHPSQTEPKSPNGIQGLPPQTCFSAEVQNGSYETDLVDEELPEDDFSGTFVSCLSKSKQQEVYTGALLNKAAIEYDHMASVPIISQSEKMPPELKDVTMKDSSEKLQDGHFAAQNVSTHVVKVPDDTNSSSNTSVMKFEGISELSLKNSQLDSQIGDTMDDEFDFYKKLEEGSVTVNEFLTHFGAKFVIHRSRPSALPDNFKSAETSTMEDLLREKCIHRPKQKVYEADCQHLSEMAEGFKTQMADQDKPLRSFNGTLLQDICAFSKDQLQRFGSKLKEQRGFFRKRNKALSHKRKEHLYAALLKTTQEANHSLTSKINETNQMLIGLDGCLNDLESELDRMNHVIMGAQQSLVRPEPALRAKQDRLDALNSEVTEKEKQMSRLDLQDQSLADTWEKVQAETRKLECRMTHLNSLNEWRVSTRDENGVVFTFLYDTAQLEVKPKKASGKDCMRDDVGGDVDISFRFLLNDCSQPSAIMVHKLLTENINSHSTWKQKYSTTQSIPMLLHDVSVVVSRLRLLGEEIHRLKRWGGLRLGILHISCVDTVVEVTFSNTRAFVKFELRLAFTPDYPFRPLQLQEFQNHIGDTRVEQIEDIVSSVRPAKNYLTTVMKRIHSDLLG